MGAKQHAVKLPFLPDSATPNEVRKYLELTLISKHDASPEQAKDIASRWGFGRGYDLRVTGLAQFEELFGKDVGSYLHRSIYQQRVEDWQASFNGHYYYYAWRLGLLAATSFVFKAILSSTESSALGNIAAALFSVGVPFFLRFGHPDGEPFLLIPLFSFAFGILSFIGSQKSSA